MSILGVFRTKRLWIALAVSVGVLLVLWAVGAMLAVKGILPQTSQTGWVAVSYIVAGALGGWIAGRKQKGSLIHSLTLALLLVVTAVLMAWILFGGISLSDGGWKIALFTVAGSLLAAFVTAGRRSGRRGRKGLPAPQKKLPRRR